MQCTSRYGNKIINEMILNRSFTDNSIIFDSIRQDCGSHKFVYIVTKSHINDESITNNSFIKKKNYEMYDVLCVNDSSLVENWKNYSMICIKINKKISYFTCKLRQTFYNNYTRKEIVVLLKNGHGIDETTKDGSLISICNNFGCQNLSFLYHNFVFCVKADSHEDEYSLPMVQLRYNFIDIKNKIVIDLNKYQFYSMLKSIDHENSRKMQSIIRNMFCRINLLSKGDIEDVKLLIGNKIELMLLNIAESEDGKCFAKLYRFCSESYNAFVTFVYNDNGTGTLKNVVSDMLKDIVENRFVNKKFYDFVKRDDIIKYEFDEGNVYELIDDKEYMKNHDVAPIYYALNTTFGILPIRESSFLNDGNESLMSNYDKYLYRNGKSLLKKFKAKKDIIENLKR